MPLSSHQYRFLKVCGIEGLEVRLSHQPKKVSRGAFEPLYAGKNVKPGNVVKYVTETLERLIDNEFMIGYGIRTPHKWYITDVRLTRKGARAVKEYEARKQQRLPIKIKIVKSRKPQY